MNKQFCKNQNGLSIIEVLIASTVLVMTILSIALLSTKSIQLSQMSLDRQKAMSIARESLEQVRYNRETKSWADFVSNYNDDISPLSTTSKPVFTRKIEVFDKTGTNTLDPNLDDIAYVKVAIGWSDSKGAHSVIQETYLRKKF